MRRVVLLFAGAAGLLAGCGNTRTAAPEVSQPATPTGFHALAYPRSGVAISVPNNWLVQSKRTPLLSTISSGNAVVALWRYRRTLPPPTRRVALGAVQRQLIAGARARDPSFTLIRSRIQTIDATPAIELDAFERVAGQPRRVRSVHVFAPGAELVLDEYAPPGIFHAVDHAVFSPLKRSLRLSAA
ncbi:MAG TPA: hypothetical protein VMU39_18785 [Solirubrobacteraceae bacterium]|nr:hypothetical protein [Solirubrobacteraceae bacterium]